MKEIKEYVKEQKAELKTAIAGLERKPRFVVIQVGDNEASNRYVRNKLKDCEEVGIQAELVKFKGTATTLDVLNKMYELKNNCKIDAYMIQFPLPNHINESEIIRYIDSTKDADGFTNNGITYPATPMGIIKYLERNDYDFEDKNALIIGRSNIVGKPMAKLLLDRNCNVTVTHSHTSVVSMFGYIDQADLIICATGHENTLTDAYYTAFRNSKPIIFDVGINFDFEGKLIGDCEHNLPYVTFQSPVPGGVGLLTRLQLLENIYTLYVNGQEINTKYLRIYLYKKYRFSNRTINALMRNKLVPFSFVTAKGEWWRQYICEPEEVDKAIQNLNLKEVAKLRNMGKVTLKEIEYGRKRVRAF